MNKGNNKKLKILITSISLLVLLGSGLLTSCNKSLNQETAETSPPVLEDVKQSSQETAGTLPYIFEGVAQPGVENAPPVEVVLETELPVVPEKLPIYQVQTVDDEYITALANRLGFSYKPSQPTDSNMPHTYVQGSDYKSHTKLPDGTQWIEIYNNGSIRLFTQMSIKNAPKSLPSFDEAVKIARDWLFSYDLYPVNVTDVKKGGGLVVTNIENGTNTSYSLVIQFKTKLGDYDQYAPTASVEVGENGKIISAYINATQLKEYGFANIKTPESALSLLKARMASPLANPPESRESLINLRSFERLSVTQVTLEYANGGGYLQPIYVFKGNAYSDGIPNQDIFVGKVDAIAR
jgi:hypothetical protein